MQLLCIALIIKCTIVNSEVDDSTIFTGHYTDYLLIILPHIIIGIAILSKASSSLSRVPARLNFCEEFV